MIATLIVPGLGGSGAGHWQHEWARRDRHVELVEQEDWHRPVLSDWLQTLEARIEAAPGVVLVAHSLGCALVAALAERPSASHVAGALLVAAADVRDLCRSHPSIESFRPERTKRLPFPSILVASRNDPFMRFRSAEQLAVRWGSALVDLGQAGHVNVASGFGFWPDAMTLADGLRGRSIVTGIRPDTRSWWGAADPRAGSAHDCGLGIA